MGTSGPSLSAMLMDPKGHKNHLSNGTPSFTICRDPGPPYARRTSEPPHISSQSSLTASDSLHSFVKDDTHAFFKGQGRGSKDSKSLATGQQQQHYNPRQLLDPKGAVVGQPLSQKDLLRQSSPSSNGARKRASEEPETRGMGSLIERVHGITQREGRPQKRQKTDPAQEDEEDEKKATFAGGGKGGEIGEYMREKRKEAEAQSGPNGAIVDLTAGKLGYLGVAQNLWTDCVSLGDDDDLVVVGEVQDKEVCYGSLLGVKVNAHLVPNPSTKTSYKGRSHWPAMKLHLSRLPGKDNIIRVIDPTGKDFGNVDVRTSMTLARIMDFRSPRFRVQARLSMRVKLPHEVPGQPCSSYYDMHINIYGPKSRATQIGNHLGNKNIWLQTPFTADPGIELCNPHSKDTPKPRTTMSSSAPREASYVYRTVEETRSEVLGMFDSLEKSENLPEMDPDSRIITPLLKHQRQGLYFMTEKEKERIFSDKEEDNNSLWRLKYKPNGQRMYYNVITGREERQKPPEVLGGILADMMGLGKTLSILSLVVGSLDSKWADQAPPEVEDGEIPLERNAKTTLLVAPLSTLANWEEQIRMHIKPGTLTYNVYHGSNRSTDLDLLAGYDMIITTYAIISSEYNRRSKKRNVSPLFQINFFRIVLDEAHMIREQSTMQSQAVCKLSSQRRWAVTGTPVQNVSPYSHLLQSG